MSTDSEKIDLLVKELQELKNKVTSFEEKEKNTMFFKFKNMIANSFVNFSNKYDFNNENNKNWENLTHKVSVVFNKNKNISNSTYKNVLESFKEISKKSNVILKTNKDKFASLKDSFYLIGSKKIIKKLQKDFSDTLSLIGFEANELYHDTNKTSFIDGNKVEENLKKELESLHFTFKDGKYENDFLNGIDDETKIRRIKTALWPSVAKKIKESMELTSIMTQFRVNNKYLALVDKFAKENDMNADDVINILEVDPNALEKGHILENKKGVLKLRENKENIMENIKRFAILAENNHALINGFIVVTENLKDIVKNTSIKDKEDIIKEINETIIFTDKNNYGFSYDNIKRNVTNVSEMDNKTKIKP